MDQSPDRSLLTPIINNAAVAAAVGGAALSAVPGSGSMLTMPIYIDMAVKIARLFDIEINKADAEKIITALNHKFSLSHTAIAVVGIVPLIGNLISAAQSFSTTKKLGELLYEYFSNSVATHAGRRSMGN